jgi:hypothetical protein
VAENTPNQELRGKEVGFLNVLNALASRIQTGAERVNGSRSRLTSFHVS